AIGILCGYGALWLFGLQHAPQAMATGVSAARVGAAALSLASTGALMILLKAAHPPAGATTLIISLGIVTRPSHLLVIEIAVAILTLQAIAINRLAGIDYPLWALRDTPRLWIPGPFITMARSTRNNTKPSMQRTFVIFVSLRVFVIPSGERWIGIVTIP